MVATVRLASSRRGATEVEPIVIVLTLVIGLAVVAFVGHYIMGSAQDTMNAGKKQTAGMGKELDTQLEVTAIYPVALGARDPAKPDAPYNGLCMSGTTNLCTLSSPAPAKARLVVEVKNTGKLPLRADHLWELKVYVNDVPAVNATDWGVSQGFGDTWRTGSTKNIVLRYDCEDIADMGGIIKVKVQPPAGTGGYSELTCEECCMRNPAYKSECAERCS